MLTFMAAMIWGFGPGGRRWLARAALGYPVGRGGSRMEPTEAIRRIRMVHDLAQNSPLDAFTKFVVGECQLWGIGPSYATKYLYLAGFDRALDDHRLSPLVLDRWVTTALFGYERRTYLTADYRTYLEFASEASNGVRVDLVEYALFKIGQGED
jgi:hypothetical protein